MHHKTKKNECNQKGPWVTTVTESQLEKDNRLDTETKTKKLNNKNERVMQCFVCIFCMPNQQFVNGFLYCKAFR